MKQKEITYERYYIQHELNNDAAIGCGMVGLITSFVGCGIMLYNTPDLSTIQNIFLSIGILTFIVGMTFLFGWLGGHIFAKRYVEVRP